MITTLILFIKRNNNKIFKSSEYSNIPEELTFFKFSAYISKLVGNLRMKVALKSDSRISLMGEIISGIQVIKMYAWEKPFEKTIKKARATEISDLTKASYCRGIFTGCGLFLEKITLFSTITSFIWFGNKIYSNIVFSIAQYCNLIQLIFAIQCPMAVSFSAECITSLKRIKDFLMMDEKETNPIGTLNRDSVLIDEVFANWTATSPTLEGITVQIPVGVLCAVVGPVGSGKSSLLQVRIISASLLLVVVINWF